MYTLGYPGTSLSIYSGDTRVSTRDTRVNTLGVPGYLPGISGYILWGYPCTYPSIFSGVPEYRTWLCPGRYPAGYMQSVYIPYYNKQQTSPWETSNKLSRVSSSSSSYPWPTSSGSLNNSTTILYIRLRQLLRLQYNPPPHRR